MEVFIAKHGGPLLLGREGENNARQIRFDVSEWETLYGPGVVQLIVQRTGEDTPYPVPLSMDGSTAVWTVSNVDTAVPGRGGKAELQYYVGATLAKSCTWDTIVIDALGEPSDTPPEAYEGWLTQILSAGSAAEAERVKAETAADAAADSAAAAKSSEGAAALSEKNAAESETKSKASEDAAALSMKNAKSSEDSAKKSEDASALSAQNAAQSESKAKSSEEAAKRSAEAAALSAKNAKESEKASKQLEVKYTQSAEQAAQNANYAKGFAESAAKSQSAAATSEQNAKTSEDNAKASEDAAALSARKAMEAGGVKTVNGQRPDENGNVEVMAGVQPDWNQNDSTQLDFIKNRPFYEEVTEATVPLDFSWDGNIDGREYHVVVAETDRSIVLCKISDVVLTMEDLSAGTMSLSYSEGTEGLSLGSDVSPSDLQESFGLVGVGIFLGDLPCVVSFPKDSTFGTANPTAGTYFFGAVPSGETTAMMYTSNLSNPDTVVTERTETVKKLDNKYLEPFNAKVTEGETLLAATQFTFTNQQSINSGAIALELGKTYSVSWDGVEYECVCKEATLSGATAAYPSLGNAGISGGTDSGEPFQIMVDEGSNYLVVFSADSVTSHTVGVAVPTTTDWKLDNKYLDLDWIPKETTELLYSGTMEYTGSPVTGYPLLGLADGDILDVTIDGETVRCASAAEDGCFGFAATTASGIVLTWVDIVAAGFGGFNFSANGTYSVEIKRFHTEPLPDKFLPNALGAPVFDLREYGLEALSDNGEFVSVSDVNVSVITAELSKGPVFLTYETDDGKVRTTLVVPYYYANNGTRYAIGFDTGGLCLVEFSFLATSYNVRRTIIIPETRNGIIVNSSTTDSTKRFKITVDDSGTITATEVS